MTEHEELSFKNHARKRALWGGTAVASSHDLWIKDPVLDVFKKVTANYGDALINCIDELVVNTEDHYVRSVEAPLSVGGPVRVIDIGINRETGVIYTWNDGPGIPVTQTWKGQTSPGWRPEAVISRERMGSNFNDDEDLDRLTGGLNGLGLKVANVASEEFGVETVCLVNRKYYTQTCRERMEYIDPPIVKDLPQNAAELRASGLRPDQFKVHTKFWMKPCYNVLNKIDKDTEAVDWYNQNRDIVENILYMRTCQVAVFVKSLRYKTVGGKRIAYTPPDVRFNGKSLGFGRGADAMKHFMKLFGLKQYVVVEMTGPEISFPWVVGIGLISEMNRTSCKSKDIELMSLVNGINILQGGSHVNMMMKKICDGLSKIAGGELGESIFKKIFCYFDCKQFPFKQIDFKGQTKEKITIGAGDQNRLREQFNFTEDQLQLIYKLAHDEITFILEKRAYAEQIQSVRSKNVGPIRKYDPPEIRGILSMMFCAEGDTALQIARDMIKMKNSPLDKRRVSTYSLQGVPPNAMKMIRVVKLGEETIIRADYQLQENITFRGLVRACGLDYEAKYEKDSDGDKEFAKLNVGCIVLTTDQDLDGVGQICSMVIVFIMIFWPKLIHRGFLKRLITPLVRVYCGPGSKNPLTGESEVGKVFEFFAERDVETWATKRWGGTNKVPKCYTIEYYKGLGGHTKEEVQNMGLTIMDKLFTITWDSACENLMKIMYGEETADRKKMLTTPVIETYPDSVWTTHKIPLSSHFMVESKEYQLMNMRRKLRSCIDGMIPTQRKVLCGGRKMFGGNLTKAKVFQVGGYIAKEMHYGQGDTSINGVLKKLAQSFEGARNIPAFVAISAGFGSNVEGCGVSGGDRYLDTKYNYKVMDLIYPPEDNWLLEYVYEDGVQCEPKYYVPIVPMAILESENTTGHGWKIDLCGRDFDWVITQIRRMINGYPALSLLGHPWMRSKGLSVRIENGKEVSYGSYNYYKDQNMIVSDQLPYRVWSYPFECNIKGIDPVTGKTERKDKDGVVHQLVKKPYVMKVKDDTNNNQNEVKIWLEPGSYEKILEEYGNCFMDPIEHFLDLRHVLITNLNMIDETNYVHEFKTYNEILEHWFPMRRDLYIARIDRMRILLEYRIQYNKELLRFSIMDGSNPKQINIDKDFEPEEQNRILEEHEFVRFNKKVLLHPGYLKANELYNAIFVEDADYEYILDINKRSQGKKYLAELEKTIRDLEQELQVLNTSDWRQIWLADLDKLVHMVHLGLKTGWKYDEKTFTFVSGIKS